MFTYFYSCICVSLKVCSSSLEKAKQIASAQPLVSSSAEIFIGQKNFKNLDSEDLQLLHQCTTDNWPTQEQDRVAIHFRSIFMPNHGHKGMLYRVGEAVLVRNSRSDTQQSVVRLTSVFAVRCSSSYYSLIKGEVYYCKRNSSGE